MARNSKETNTFHETNGKCNEPCWTQVVMMRLAAGKVAHTQINISLFQLQNCASFPFLGHIYIYIFEANRTQLPEIELFPNFRVLCASEFKSLSFFQMEGRAVIKRNFSTTKATFLHTHMQGQALKV